MRNAENGVENSTSEREELGALCNAAKYVAAEAAYDACENAGVISILVVSLSLSTLLVMTHGGMGYAAEYHVERYLRESFVPRLAPVSREMILNYVGQRVLGCKLSFCMSYRRD